MAFDEGLAQRIRELLEEHDRVVEKRMFGGVCFLVRGNMACGVYKESLIARVGPEAHAAAMKRRGAGPFDITGHAMKGWVMVAPEGLESDRSLAELVALGVGHAQSLPQK